MKIERYKSRKETIKRRLKTVLGVLLVAVIIAGVAWVISPMKVTNPELIQTLEASDPSYEEDVKMQLAKIVKEKLGVEPEKIAFKVFAPNEASNYDVVIYYKVEGEWYAKSKGWSSSWISCELDKELVRVAAW